MAVVRAAGEAHPLRIVLAGAREAVEVIECARFGDLSPGKWCCKPPAIREHLRSPVLILIVLALRSDRAKNAAQRHPGGPDVRKTEMKQAHLTTTAIAHPHARELEALSAILDANPQLAELAHRDLVGGERTDIGREGMSGEQALRVALLKQIESTSCRERAFRLVDSSLFGLTRTASSLRPSSRARC